MAETIEVNYLAYTLRLWRVDDGGGWRATIYNPRTGERQGFASIALLSAFLQAVTGATTEEQQQQDASGWDLEYKRDKGST